MSGQTIAVGEQDQQPREASRWPWPTLVLLGLIPLVIGAYLSVEGYFQRGIIGRIADWQFGRFGQTLPIFNIAILLVLGALVCFFVEILATRRKRQDAATTDHVEFGPDGVPLPDSLSEPADGVGSAAAALRAKTLYSARRFTRVLFSLGFAAIVVALLITLWALILPARVSTATIGTPTNGVVADRVVQGRAEGRLLVSITQDILIVRRNAYFVPLIDPAEPRVIRNFVEFVPDDRWNGMAVPQVDTAALFHTYDSPLPSFVPTLYASSGYAVARPYQVLTTRTSAIQAPYFIAAVQLALIGLLILCAGLVQRWHTRRLARGMPINEIDAEQN